MASVAQGLTVLDLTQGFAGNLATMVLSDAGARVIKIEPPVGDYSRSEPAWPMWNRGKQSVVLDLTTPEGRSTIQALAATADVVVTNYPPDEARRLGVAYELLAPGNPRLVYCGISGFGPLPGVAHLKDYDGIVTAKTGRAMNFATLTPDGAPGYVALHTASYGAGMFAVTGIMAALYAREETGAGQKVETSLLQGMLPYDWMWLRWQMAQKGDDGTANFARGAVPTAQYFVARCKDGRWIQMANAMTHLFVNFMLAIGLGDVLSEERYMSLPNTPAGPDLEELYEKIYARMQEKTLDEWMEVFSHQFDVAAEPFMHTQEAFTHPQVLHNGNVVEVDDPAIGHSKQLGPLASFEKTPMAVQGPSPRLGQHTGTVLTSLPKVAIEPAGGTGGSKRYPLEGVTVLEFATWFAGPYGPAILAELGARVIKVEPLEGDPFRRNGPIGARTQQGKEDIAIDLKTPEGRKIAHELIKQSDIVMHNFRPGVAARLGIDYDTCKALNPSVIYNYAGAYGSTGPSSHRPAMHPIPGAVCGGAMVQAGRHMPPPADQALSYPELRFTSQHLFRSNEGNPDVTSAIGVATALALALYARKRTGEGQYVETTMVCSNLYANSDDFIQYQGKPDRLLPDPELRGLHALYRFYQAKDGKWAFLAAPLEEEWQAFARAAGRADLLSDARFATRAARLQHDDALIAILKDMFAQRTASEWESFLAGHGVACAEAYPEELAAFSSSTPAMQSSGLWQEVSHPSMGAYLRQGPVINFSAMGNHIGALTYLGEHTESILQGLGHSSEEISALMEKRVVVATSKTVPVA